MFRFIGSFLVLFILATSMFGGSRQGDVAKQDVSGTGLVLIHEVKFMDRSGTLTVCNGSSGQQYPAYWPDPVPVLPYNCDQTVTVSNSTVFFVAVDGVAVNCGGSFNPSKPACKATTSSSGYIYAQFVSSGAVCKIGGSEYVDPLTGKKSRIFNGYNETYGEGSYYGDFACNRLYSQTQMRGLYVNGVEVVCKGEYVNLAYATNCKPGKRGAPSELYKPPAK